MPNVLNPSTPPTPLRTFALLLLAVWMLAAVPAPAFAQTPLALPTSATPVDAPLSLASQPASRHAVYVEANSLLLATGSLGVAYEYRPFRGFAISAGMGGAYLVDPCIFGCSGGNLAVAGQVLAHGLFGWATPHSCEVALGVAAGYFHSADSGNDHALVEPAAFLGYRYHPLEAGRIFRAGIGWSYLLGVGLSVSAGEAF